MNIRELQKKKMGKLEFIHLLSMRHEEVASALYASIYSSVE